jgi:hypothetical protein
MKIFGDVDRTKEGKIKSEYPAWYLNTHKEELEESVKHRRYMLENDLVDSSEKNIQKKRLEQESKRLAEIEASAPKLSGAELDEVSRVHKEMGGQIKEAMYTRSDMERGTADAHEEARRISTPVIEVKNKAQAEFLESCGIKLDGRTKVTRREAEKAWKISGKLVGEASNTETLRKE